MICSEEHFSESGFLSNVYYCKYYWSLVKTFRTFGAVFSAGLSNFLSAYRGQLFSENRFSCKFCSTILFDFLLIKFWQSHEHFNFWCPMDDSGKTYFFEKRVFLKKFFSGLRRALTGVWPGILRRVCWSNILLGQGSFVGQMFFEKRSTSKTSAEVEISTCGHWAQTFWQGFQSCFLVFEKTSLRKNKLFRKKNILFEGFGTLMEQIEKMYGIFSSVVKTETYFYRITSRGKMFFWGK